MKKTFVIFTIIITMLLNIYVYAGIYSEIDDEGNFIGNINEPGYYNTLLHSSNNSAISLDTRIIDVVTGYGIFAAIDSEGNLFMWGNDYLNKLNIPAELPPIKKVAIGNYHVVALDVNGVLHGWGDTTYGEIDFENNLPRFIDMDADGYNTVAITEDGKVYSWGRLNNGEQQNVPKTLGKAVSVDIGPYVRAIINAKGTVETWDWTNPPKMSVKAKQVSCVDYEVIVLGEDGLVYGNEIYRDANFKYIKKPSMKNIVQIDRTFAIDADGKLYAWGTDYRFENSSYSPFDIPVNLKELKDISVSAFDAIALGKDGLIYHWGRNANNIAIPEYINGFSYGGPIYPDKEVNIYPYSMTVKTEDEFYEAIRAYPQCKNIVVDGTINIKKDINIKNNVTLTINSNSILNIYALNFYLNGGLENNGEIKLYGRIVIDGERANYGIIKRCGGCAAIRMKLYRLSDIEKYINGNTVFTEIYDKSYDESRFFIIDKNTYIPQNFFIHFGKMTLVVNEGVVLTNNGTIWTHSDPLIKGKVQGNAIVTFHDME